MNIVVEILLTVCAIYACTIVCLLYVICYILKSSGGQNFEFSEASLPDQTPDYKESTFLDLEK